jgi:hypothetical protein
MKRLTLGLALAGLVAFSAVPAAAQSAKVYAIHGIPGGDLGTGVDPALPVDILVNGACAITDFRFGQILGPLPLAAGTNTFDIKLKGASGPCSGQTAIGPAVISFSAGETATVIAHLTAAGAPTASKFTNDVSRISAGRARIAAHHTAAAPPVDVVVSRDIFDPTAPTVTVPDFVNGDSVATLVQPGTWQAALELAGTNTVALGPAKLQLRPYTAYFVYAVGSASTGSLTFLVNTIGNLK